MENCPLGCGGNWGFMMSHADDCPWQVAYVTAGKRMQAPMQTAFTDWWPAGDDRSGANGGASAGVACAGTHGGCAAVMWHRLVAATAAIRRRRT